MNRNQKFILIGAGAAILLFQLYGIWRYGLDDSRGWPISFVLAAILLFVGFSSWRGFPALLKTKEQTRTEPPTIPSSSLSTPLKRSIKHRYGVHISEMDLTIEAHKSYAYETNIYDSLGGNGRSLNWNVCASVYGSMKYAARKANMAVNRIVWNTIVRSIVIRMATEEIEGVGMGSPEFNELETDAYSDLEMIDRAVEDSIAGKGKFAIEPLVQRFALMFGTKQDSQAALSAIIGINAEAAHKKIIPELLEDLS